METGNKNHKETSLYIRQSKISPAEVEMSHGDAKSRIREEVMDAYLNYYNDSSSMKNSNVILKFALFGVVAVVLGFTAALILNQNPEEESSGNDTATTLKAAVTYTEGDVEIMLEDGRWMDIGDQATLEEGDSFRIVGEGKGVLTIDDGSAVRLAANTTISLTSLDPKNIVISNEGGEVYTRMDKSERVFVVETADATYTSLGTAYKTIQTETKKGVYVYESKVEAKPTNAESVVVNEGEKFLLNQETPVAPIAYEDITDTFTQWNKETDAQEFGTEAAVFTKLEQEKTAAEKAAQEEAAKQAEAQKQAQEQTPAPAPAPAPAPSPVASMSLGGHADANTGGINLNWVPSNIDVSKGFKVVFSKTNPTPTFGVDDAKYFSDQNQRSAFMPFNDGKTYYFRVCRYTGGACDTYSNTMTITAPGAKQEAPKQSVSSISLNHNGGGNVNWSVNGYSAKGYKVVWSKNPSATYPTRSGDQYIYLSNPSEVSTTVNAFDGAGTYYVRVCEYLGGACGVYSNEVAVNL